MNIPPLAAGAGAGLLLALALAPLAGSALGDLATARAERDARLADARVPEAAPAPLVVAGLVTGTAETLIARVRARAKGSGVLVEEAKPLPAEGDLVTARLRLSGPEKSVIALADSLEREPPLVRFSAWRMEAIEGGVRLTADAVAVRR